MPLLTGLTDSEPLLAFATPPTQESADDLVQRIKLICTQVSLLL